MTLPHIFTFDDVFDFDVKELENYNWQVFPNHNTASWQSSRVYEKNVGVWDEDTPEMCKKAHELSLEIFKRINPNSEFKSLLRCFIHKFQPNILMDVGNIHRDGWYVDGKFHPNIWSTIFYVEGNGPTDFFSDRKEEEYTQSVEFKKGRVSVFPAGYWHRPSKEHTVDRYIIAFIYEVHNLVPEMNDYRPLCMCGKSREKYCTGMHNPD